MRFFLHALCFSFCLSVAVAGQAQITRLSNNTNIEEAIPLGNIAVLISKSDSLWRTDGTAGGTLKYTNLVSVADPHEVTLFQNKIFFNGKDANGSELWVTNGTEAGTGMVKNINPAGASSSPSDFYMYNNLLYFFADDGVHGRELWVSNGTEGGTLMLKDINPGLPGSAPFSAEFFTYKGLLYFTATTAANGTELWVTNGTEGGTTLFKDIRGGSESSGPNNFIALGSIIVFTADDGVAGRELWRTDGSAGGTTLVKDISPNLPFGFGPSFFTVFNNKLYFTAFTLENGNEPWISDGTTDGTQLLKDIEPEEESSSPLFLNSLVTNNKMIFSATTSDNGWELWSTDGTGANTNLFKDINEGPDDGEEIFFLNAYNATDLGSIHATLQNGIAYLRAKTPGAGTELWKTNGTPEGTVIVKDINPGADSSLSDTAFTYFFTPNNLYFSATDGQKGNELWKTDGSEANTTRVIDLNPGAGSSDPQFIGAFNGIYLFTATDGDNASGLRDLYRLDGNFAPLPLTLLQFAATPQDNSVRLNWTTTAEVNTAFFGIERSKDGTRFETVGKVNAIKNTADKKEYVFDDPSGMNNGNKVYYRLKMVDQDGSFSYSKIVAVAKASETRLAAFPNPAVSELNVTVSSGNRKQQAIRIFDESGKQVYQQQLSGAQGNNSYRINVISLPRGSYYLNVVTEGGVETTKFIKK